jgi:hypothetical protein
MPRSVLIFALCLPLAVLMGFMLSDPLAGGNMMVGGIVVIVMMLPLLIAYHHRALVWMASTYMNMYILKGQPQIWMILAGVSFVFAVVSKPLGKGLKPVWTREFVFSLLILSAVIFGTSVFTGGIGVRAMGSSTYGGRRYIFLLAGILGLFALTSQPLPRPTAEKDFTLYLLGPITAAFSNIAYMLGPSFYFLFLLFPVDMAIGQAASEMDAFGMGSLQRINGFGPAGVAIVSWCFFKWGLAGVLKVNKPWRMIMLLAGFVICFASGFRSTMGIILLLALVQFFAEGLHRTRYAFALVAASLVIFVLLLGFADRLPLSAQRVISFLPVKVDERAAMDAKGSTEWRLEMWSMLRKDIPKYFWLGKGYVIDPTDLYFADESIRRGFTTGYEFSIKAGDYHSGPFSVIIPFGIWGVLGLTWFFWVCMKITWHNYRFSEPELKKLNTFMFSLYVSRLIFFLFFFGSIEVDLWQMGSVAAISLCVNNGMRRRVRNPQLRFEPQAARQREAVMAGI